MSRRPHWTSTVDGTTMLLVSRHTGARRTIDLTRCPQRLASPAHWREDGECHCADTWKRWPWEPLERLALQAAARGGPEYDEGHYVVGDRSRHWDHAIASPENTARMVARALDISDRQVFRYRQWGLLTDRQADQYAIRLGLHPALVWGDAWWDAAPDALFDPEPQLALTFGGA